jgi:hypothetical protein
MKAGTISGSVGMATKIAVTNISKNQKQRRDGKSLRNIRPLHILRKIRESWGLTRLKKSQPIILLSSAPSRGVSVTFTLRTTRFFVECEIGGGKASRDYWGDSAVDFQ